MKTLIVSGGNVEKEILNKTIKNNNFDNVIAVDKGLEILDECNIQPNYIIGDFDSVNQKIISKYDKEKTIKLNPEKDFTDTHMAIKLAIQNKSNYIIVLGGIGTRIDHTIANVHILKECIDNKIRCEIINEKNKIFLINKSCYIDLDEKYKYISLIPLTTQVTGVTLKGFKYLLQDATLTIGESIGVSNEQIEKRAEVKLKDGILICIESKD
ncbi:MAG TPA: thiamine diphosphokinase [Clostridiaceae bacterium]|jgi:thiamine diphosphokinase|nr:thiamine diphosphokinase [Clostridiaceae bacterium]